MIKNNKYYLASFLAIDFILIILICFYHSSLVEKSALPAKYMPQVKNFSFNINGINKSENVTRLANTSIRQAWEIKFCLTDYAKGDSVEIQTENNGMRKIQKIRLEASNTQFNLFTIYLASALYLFTGIFIIIKHRKENFAMVLHWLTVVTAIMVVFDTGYSKMFSPAVNFLILSIFNIGAYLLPALFLHFSFIYPVSDNKYKLMFLVPFYFASFTGIIVCLLNAASFIFFQKNVGSTYYIQFHTYIADIILIIGLILTVAKFEHSALTITEPLLRRKIYWALLGISFGPFVYVFMILMPRLILGHELVSDSLMQITILFAPVMFLISVSQRKRET